MTITWVTSANVVVCGGNVQVGRLESLTCEVFVLVVAMVEETLGTGETGDALNALPQHVWTIPTRARPVL